MNRLTEREGRRVLYVSAADLNDALPLVGLRSDHVPHRPDRLGVMNSVCLNRATDSESVVHSCKALPRRVEIDSLVRRQGVSCFFRARRKPRTPIPKSQIEFQQKPGAVSGRSRAVLQFLQLHWCRRMGCRFRKIGLGGEQKCTQKSASDGKHLRRAC